MEDVSDPAVERRNTSRPLDSFAFPGETAASEQVLMLRKDVFLVFRALCKLSMKAASEQAGASDPFALKGKVLSLELIKVLLQAGGNVFRSHERFVDAIRQYLCLSLLKNCASTIVPAFQLSAAIFQTLVERYRASLKSQIGVFFPMIFLRPFESHALASPKGGQGAYETYSLLAVVFRCLHALCGDRQVLSDIFVNFDCDLNESNLFERTVAGLVRLVQGTSGAAAPGLTPTMEFNLRYFALQCLVEILKSLASGVSGLNDSGSEAAGDSDAEEEPTNGEAGEEGSLEQRKAYKTEYQRGIIAFNKKPKKGIEYLQKNEMLGTSAKEVAHFLATTAGLAKRPIGDYLGEGDAFNIQVMHAFIERLDFAGMDFDVGIRHLLSGFLLPGEAQKIDRLMEKFAERFYICNPNSFQTAETAYVLAFSVIMLNTDAHNPQVKNKMTLEGFLRNNSGIDDGKDLPKEFLTKLYGNIVSHEIRMKAEGAEVEVSASRARPTKSASIPGLDTILGIFGGAPQLAAEPDDEAVRQAHQSMKEKGAQSVWVSHSGPGGQDAGAMLEAAWAPILGAISVGFEENDDDSIAALCLEAFYHVLRAACPLGMTTVRDAFLTSLAKATHLQSLGAPLPPSGLDPLSPKRGEAFRTLLRVAQDAGNSLGGGWKTVLTCVSQYDRAWQLEGGAISDAKLFSGTPNRGGAAASPPPSPSPSPASQKGARKTPPPGRLSQVFGASCTDLVPLLYASSEQLSSTAVVDFVKALCEVSRAELADASSPRVFTLAKIVEVSHFNMGRVRIVWSRIWSMLAEFFIHAGCHSNLDVAMYAIDGLRQLAMKFLQRDELANYTFQNDFLKPFVTVMRQSRSVEVRELIIRCVSQFILARVANVKSGWRSMFMVFTTAAGDESRQIVALAFETIEKIVREYFSHVTETETATFTDCVNCLIAFANSPLTDVSLNAIAFLRFCALKLAAGELGVLEAPSDALKGAGLGTSPPGTPRFASGELGSAPGTPRAQLFTDKDVHVYFWFPLLAGLSELTFDTREEIRHSSLEVLVDTLDYHGESFSQEFWVRVFNSILFPIFDHVRAEVLEANTFVAPEQRAGVDAWLYETCRDCLRHVIDLYAKFFKQLRGILPKFVAFVVEFATRSHDRLAAMGVAALSETVKQIGGQLTEQEWRVVLSCIARAVEETLPDLDALLASEGGKAAASEGEGRPRARSLAEGSGARRLKQIKCRVQVQVLFCQCLGEIYQAFGSDLSAESSQSMLASLQEVNSHSRRANLDAPKRAQLRDLQAAGGLQPPLSLPDPPLGGLERESLSVWSSVLMELVARGKAPEGSASQVLDAVLRELETFLALAGKDGDTPSECAHRLAILARCLGAVSALDSASLEPRMVEVFTELTRLVECPHANAEVLSATSRIFQAKVLPFIQAHQEARE